MKRFAQVVFVFAFTALPCAAQDKVDGFIARVYKNRSGHTMPYRLFIPERYDRQKKYPLVLWLHGGGGTGNDNLQQILGDQVPGTRTWTTPENQTKYPAFVLAPQSSGIWSYSGVNELHPQMLLVLAILDSLKLEFSIDSQRIYVAGQSNGGRGTWDVITKKPDLFAAAIPVCGGGDPRRASTVAGMPIWVFHGDADSVIPVTESRAMIAAIKKAGGSPRYTEYRGVGHDVWARTFKEPGLVDWLFAQHK